MNKAVNFRYHSVGTLKNNISMQAIECVGKIQFNEYMVLGHSSDIFSCCVDCRLTHSWSGNANLQWAKKRASLLTAYLLAHLAAKAAEDDEKNIAWMTKRTLLKLIESV